MTNYEYITGPFIGEVVEDGTAMLDVAWDELDEDMQDRILDWGYKHLDRTKEDLMERYENSWESVETDKPVTLVSLKEQLKNESNSL